MTTSILLTAIPTRNIPARSITKAVVTVPPDEWNRMCLQRRILRNIPLLLVLGYGIVLLTTSQFYLPYLINDWAFDLTTGSGVLGLLVVILFIPAILFFMIFKILEAKSVDLQPALLKRHGWDGKMRREVEVGGKIVVGFYQDDPLY